MKTKNLAWLGTLVLFLTTALIFNSCQKETELLGNMELPEDVALKSGGNHGNTVKNYDKRMGLLAKSLAKSLEDKELRAILKEKALEEWTGDYEFLYKHVKERVLLSTNTKIKHLLADNLEVANENNLKQELKTYNPDSKYRDKINKKNGRDLKSEYLDKFSEDFPCLQIAVRGPVKDWDVDNVHPKVVYVCSGFEEDWLEMDAFGENGRVEKLDLSVEFDQPVVVLMKSERTDFQGELLNSNKKSCNLPINSVVSTIKLNSEVGDDKPATTTTPPPPTNVATAAHPTAMYVDWDWDGPHDKKWICFNVYRTGNGIISKHVGTVYSGYTTEFYDREMYLGVNIPYKYRIRAYAISQAGYKYSDYSEYSEWVTTPQNNRQIVSFNAKSEGLCAALNWVRPEPLDYMGINIYRKLPGQGFSLYGRLEGTNQLEYQICGMNTTQYGDLVEYKITTYDAYGESSARYDAAYACERANTEPLYITHIKIDALRSVESQIFGRPEFQISVAHHDPDDFVTSDGDNTQVEYIKKDLILPHPPRYFYIMQSAVYDGLFEGIYNEHVTNWDNSMHKNVLNFHIAEYDDQTIGTVYDAMLGVFKAAKTNLDTASGTKINLALDVGIEVMSAVIDEWAMTRGTRRIGEDDYRWWYSMNYTLSFGFGCKMRLSNTPYTGDDTWLSDWDY